MAGQGGEHIAAQSAALAPGPRQPDEEHPPSSPSLHDFTMPQLAPSYDALPSQPFGIHEYLQRAPSDSFPRIPYPAAAPSPMHGSDTSHIRTVTASVGARPPSMSATAAAAPANALAASPLSQFSNATIAEPLHSRSLAPAIQDGTLDLHGNGSLVHSSSIGIPLPAPQMLNKSVAPQSSASGQHKLLLSLGLGLALSPKSSG